MQARHMRQQITGILHTLVACLNKYTQGAQRDVPAALEGGLGANGDEPHAVQTTNRPTTQPPTGGMT